MKKHPEKKPQEVALEIIHLGKPVTPTEINNHVGIGPYASKYICFLRRLGFEFDTKKNGLAIVSYTLINEPENAKEIRAGTKIRKAPKAKVFTAKVNKAAKTAKSPQVTSNLDKIKAVAEKMKKKNKTVEKIAPVSTSSDTDWEIKEDEREVLKSLGL